MYGLTRGAMTLIGAIGCGLILWITTQLDGNSQGDYWSVVGLLAAAGFVVALSQLLGGWTKWGWPRFSGAVFVFGFLPVLLTVGWLVLAYQPDHNWFQRHVEDWSDDIGLSGIVRDLGRVLAATIFAMGLFFGLTFDTTGPRTGPVLRRRRRVAPVPTEHPLTIATEGDDRTEANQDQADRGAVDDERAEKDRTMTVPRDSEATSGTLEARERRDAEAAPGQHPLASGETAERRAEDER